MMEYRPKCRDFMLSMGLDDTNLRISQITRDNLVEKAEQCLAHHEDLRSQLFERGAHYKLKLIAAADRLTNAVVHA